MLPLPQLDFNSSLGLGLGFGPNGLSFGNNGHQDFGLRSDGFHVRRKREVRFVDDIMKRKK